MVARDARGGGRLFVQVGLIYGEHCTYEDYLRAAHKNLMMGGDAFYCAGSLDTITKLAAEGIPVVGHVGLIPARATWTGGFKAVGKTAAQALQVYQHVKALEAAGAVAAEIEVVPARVASEISKRTSLTLMSMGAGSGCDAQYLLAEDVLGCSRGHQPRHAKVYRNFRAEYDAAARAHRRFQIQRDVKRASSRRTSISCRSPTPSSRCL